MAQTNQQALLAAIPIYNSYLIKQVGPGLTQTQLDNCLRTYGNRINGICAPITREMTAKQVMAYLAKRCD